MEQSDMISLRATHCYGFVENSKTFLFRHSSFYSVLVFTARCYAERSIAVCLSVTLKYRDHIGQFLLHQLLIFGALKPGFRRLATLKLKVTVLANFRPKRTAAAALLSCSLRSLWFLIRSR